MKTKPPHGTLVRMTKKWQASVGLRGEKRETFVVQACDCELCKSGQFVSTFTPSYDGVGFRHINIANVEVKK